MTYMAHMQRMQISGSHEDGIKVLRDTREHLFEKGWQKGSYGTDGGPNCLVGALMNVSVKGYEVAYNALRELVGYVPHFNDNKVTTFNDVIDTLDLAIKNLEG